MHARPQSFHSTPGNCLDVRAASYLQSSCTESRWSLAPRRRAACILQTAPRSRPDDRRRISRNLQGHCRGGQRAGRPPSAINSKVVVCGASGEPGRFVFGYVQRAAQTFESGLTAPRALVGAGRQPRQRVVWLPVSFLPTPTSRSCRGAISRTTKFKKRLGGCSMGWRRIGCPRVPSPSGMGPGPGGRESEPFLRSAPVCSRAHVRRAAPAGAAAARSDSGASGVPHAPRHEGPRDHKMEFEQRMWRGAKRGRLLGRCRWRLRHARRADPGPTKAEISDRCLPTARRRREWLRQRSTPRSSRRPRADCAGWNAQHQGIGAEEAASRAVTPRRRRRRSPATFARLGPERAAASAVARASITRVVVD